MKLKSTAGKRFLKLFPLVFLLSVNTYAQSLTGKYPVEKLIERMERFRKDSGSNIIFDSAQLGDTQAPPLEINGESLENAIRKSLRNTAFTVEKTGASFVIRPEKTQARSTGSIAGTVVDEKGEPVIGAVVVALGLPSIGAATGIDGKYTLHDMPAKTVSVQFSLMSYETLVVEGVTVAADKTIPLNVVLKEAVTQLNEVVVTADFRQASAAGLYAMQKLNASMTDGLSADLIRRTSDNNVAQALRRVAGVTVNDGKFVTVRGMSERYNNVQLNGSSLPSTEPNRRNFSFDIIPSSLIESVVVNKTFTPDLPGEFTGGLVQVSTLSVPDEKFFSLSAGSGMNTLSTGRDFQTNQRFEADYLLGEVDGRTWYAGHAADQIPLSEANAAQLNHYKFYNYRAAPLRNYSLSFGLPVWIKERHKLGIVGAVTYRHEETREDIKEVNTFGRDTLVRNLSDQFNKSYKFVTSLGAVANLGWQTTNHAVTWRNLFNNRFTHTTLNRVIWKEYDNVVQPEIYASPLQARLLQTQLDGEHSLFKRRLKLTWNADYNQTSRISPDDRFAQGLSLGGTPGDTYLFNWMYGFGPSRPYTNSQFVMHSRLDETKWNAGANAEYSFLLSGFEQKLKAGFHRSERSADYDQTYLHVFSAGAASSAPDGTSLHRLFDPANFESGAIYYKTESFHNRTVDYYEGDQSIDAFYLMGEITPLKPLRIIGGIRLEDAETTVMTRTSGYDINGKLNTSDSILTRPEKEWLPSVTAIYSITSNLNFRASYSESLARADFRELSWTQYYNVTDRVNIRILKPIETSSSRNYDLRLEWYPSLGEVVSVSAFYKEFDKPVEKVMRVMADLHNFDLLTVNLDRSVMRGLELNFRKSFAFITPPLRNLWLSGNFALIEGTVEAGNEVWTIEKRKRPLQGLAPYNANAALAYEGDRFGAAVNYTRVGRTLVYGGDYDYTDQYEAPRNVLDLQLSARFFKRRLEVKLNASDVLNEDIIVYRNMSYYDIGGVLEDGGIAWNNTALGMDYNEGDYVMSRIGRGVNLSATVSYRF